MGWTEWADTVEVEPSIYASDFSRLGDQLGTLIGAGARDRNCFASDGHLIQYYTKVPNDHAAI
jgi:pentose-5-phosphate-3-epimerase